MPVYEYACATCGEHFEQYRAVRARSGARCPECGGRGQKVFRPVGIIFKGTGFHSTDYRKPESKDEPATAGAGGKPAPSASGTDEGGKSD
jgi:putative FmdB family regulatory protein